MKRELKEYNNNVYNVLENGNIVFKKFSNGDWNVKTYDDRGNALSSHWKNGNWYVRTYDERENMITAQWSNGDKYEYTYDNKDNLLTNTLNGKLIYKRKPKELTLQQVIDELGYEIKLTKEGTR